MTVYDGYPFVVFVRGENDWLPLCGAWDPRVAQMAICYAMGCEEEKCIVKVERKMPNGETETSTGDQFLRMRVT